MEITSCIGGDKHLKDHKTITPAIISLTSNSTTPASFESSSSHQASRSQTVNEAALPRSHVEPPVSQFLSAKVDQQALEEESDRRLAEQEARSASRMERERKLKEEADKVLEESEREEKELLKRVEEVRRKKELQAKAARDRVEKAEAEEMEKVERLKEENATIKARAITTTGLGSLLNEQSTNNCNSFYQQCSRVVPEDEGTSFTQTTSAGMGVVTSPNAMLSRKFSAKPPPLSLSAVCQSPTRLSNASITEEKPEINRLVDQMAGMIQT